MEKHKRLLYIYENAPHGYAVWRAGEGPATHLFGLPYLEDRGWVVTIRDFLEFQGLAGFFRLRQATKDADVVLSPLGIPFLLLSSWLRGRAPWVILAIDTVMVYRSLARWKQKLFIRALRRAAHIVCLADFQKEFLGSVSVHPDRMTVVPLGGDPVFYKTREPSEEFIFAVGRDPGRDFGTLVEAARGLPSRVVIATSRKIAATFPPLPPNVEVLQNTPITQTRDLLARSLAVVISSHSTRGSDCSGQTVLLDAWSTGKAVVVSDRPWVTTYVRAGTDALVVPPQDVLALRAALSKLLGDPEMRHRLAATGHEQVVSRFNGASMGAQLEAILNQLVAS